MSGYNATQTDGSPTPIPMSSAISPGDPTPYPIMGGPKFVDSQSNTQVPVAMVVMAGVAVALSSPPANTNAGSSTTLTFASQVGHWLIQNTSGVNAYIELDAVATTGSVLLLPGAMWRDDIPVTAPHVYTASAIPVNAVGGLIVKGWA